MRTSPGPALAWVGPGPLRDKVFALLRGGVHAWIGVKLLISCDIQKMSNKEIDSGERYRVGE